MEWEIGERNKGHAGNGVGMQVIVVGMWGITVGMRGIGVGMRGI